MLNYFYMTEHFGNERAFADEAAAVLLDAQDEAEKQKVEELIVIAGPKQQGVLSLLTGSKRRSWLYRRINNEWQKVRED